MFRTIAGHVEGVLKDIATLDGFASSIEELMIIKHTGLWAVFDVMALCGLICSVLDCGATYYTDEGVRSSLIGKGVNENAVQSLSFGAFKRYLICYVLLNYGS